MTTFEQLPGLPPYGPPAIGFPSAWAARGSEGVVVRFAVTGTGSWVGNFQPGLGGLSSVMQHPNGRDILVASNGNLFSVDPLARSAIEIRCAVFAATELPGGIVFENQGVAFFRVGEKGIVWHTRRISWDGFQNVKFEGDSIFGEAWAPLTNGWLPFEVCLSTGRAKGGSYNGPDHDEWEELA